MSINRAAKDLRALVESASRGLSIETFAKFENDLFQVRALANPFCLAFPFPLIDKARAMNSWHIY